MTKTTFTEDKNDEHPLEAKQLEYTDIVLSKCSKNESSYKINTKKYIF